MRSAPLLGYLVLAIVLTWPMAGHFASHVPGDGIDDPSLAWNLWWVKHALVDQPQNPFNCDWQFWPVGINLAFYTLTILNGLLSVPLQTVFGLVPAYNLLLLSSFVLGGYGAYLLSLELLRPARDPARCAQPVGAPEETGRMVLDSPSTRPKKGLVTACVFLGGALYAFASAKLFYAALGQANIASSQWAPFAALYMLRAARQDGRWREAALAALFVLLQAYAELTYASFLVVFAAIVAAYAVFVRLDETRWPRLFWRRLLPVLGRFALMGCVVALGLAPFLANMVPDLQAEGDLFSSGGGFADIFSADLAGYLLPTQLHPLFGDVIRTLSDDSIAKPDGTHFAVNKGQHIYIGYVALTLALIGIWRTRRKRVTWLWAGAAGLFFLLTLGPSLRVAGHDLGIPLPFGLVARLPLFEGNRYPSRYSIMLLMSLAPLAAAGAFAVAGLVGRRIVASKPVCRDASASRGMMPFVLVGGLLSLLLFEHLSVPLPLSDLRVPPIYDLVAAQPGDFALLELPLGWRNGARVVGKQDIVIMQELWYQSKHGKRLLGGNTSRNPEFKFQYFSEDLTLARLIAITNAADVPQHEALREALTAIPITDADRARARAWAATLGIRYVMVHRDKLTPAAESTLRALLPVTMIAEEGHLALYAIAEELWPPQAFAPGTDAGRMVLAEGWSPPARTPEGKAVYAQRREVRLLLPLGSDETQVRLEGRALLPDQVVTPVVDGKVLPTRSWPEPAKFLTFAVPSDPARPILSDVRLRFSSLVSVDDLPGAPWPWDALFAGSPASFLLRSAGQETGDFAHLYVNGVDVSPNQRGYNLVALHPDDGHLLAVGAFDTHADPGASLALADWVGRMGPGTIVLGAVRDEASLRLGQVAVDALGMVGVAGDLRGHFRWSHAFAGVVGMRPGQALEAMDGLRPAQVSVGLPVSEPEIAAMVVNITLAK